MIKTSTKFSYPVLDRIATPNGRRYAQPNGVLLPSVTTILDQTVDKSGLTNWRNFVGDTKADQIVLESTNVGTLLHKSMERYLLGETVTFGNNHIQKIVKGMFNQMVEHIQGKLTTVYGIEQNLYVQDLYAGTTDLICEYNGSICILDFKNSKKKKEEKYLTTYFTQLAAYAMAHNEMFGTDIQSGVLLISIRPSDHLGESKLDEVVLEGEKFKNFSKVWLEHVEKYYAQNPDC